jgi:hypothetical protein
MSECLGEIYIYLVRLQMFCNVFSINIYNLIFEFSTVINSNVCDNAYCYALYVRTICCDASTAYISHSYYIRMHDYMDCIIIIYIIYV